MKFLRRLPLFLAFALAFTTAARAQVPALSKSTPADITAAGIGVQLTGADYGNSTFVLAAYFGGTTAVPAITPAVYTSADGKAWTRRTLPVGGARIGRPRFLNGKFFLGLDAATNSNGQPTGTNGAVLTSTDGITWTAVTLSAPFYGPSNFAFGNSVYVGSVSGVTGASSQIVTSTDGINWTPRAIGGANFVSGVTFFGGKFYAGDFNAGLFGSADGVTWTKVSAGPANPNLVAATSSALLVTIPSTFAGSTSTAHQMLSTDGTTFTAAAPGQSLLFESIVALNGAFTTVVPVNASSSDSTQVVASFDGKTWATIATAPNQYSAADLAYGNGRYVFVGEFDVFNGVTTVSPGGTSSGGGGGTTTGTIPTTVAELSASALAGKTLTFTIVGGNSPFESSGTFTLQLDSPSAGKYTIPVSSGSTTAHSDNYTYSANAEGGKLNLNNYLAGQDAVGLSLFAAGTGTANATSGAGKSYFEMSTAGANKRGTFTIGTSTGSGGTTTAPTVAAQPAAAQTAAIGGSITFNFSVTGTGITYQWNFNGTVISGAVSASYTIGSVTAASAGSYTVTATVSGGGSVTSDAAILGLASLAKVAGLGTEVGPNTPHPNGNVYDQVLLQGSAATITADANQVTRMSFIDLTNDIVQIEFTGAGTLSLVLDNPTGPAAPTSYNQPGTVYMKGHPSIVVTGANETSNLSIFTVGRATAFDPTGAFNIVQPISSANNPANNGSPLFQGQSATVYDGVADIASISIVSTNGKFGGVRAANASFYATKGTTGLYAPGVQFTGPVYVSDINAFATASPVLILGSCADVRITGGDLLQSNAQPVKISGVTQLKFTAGATSGNIALPVQNNKAVLQQNGTDVTTQLVVYP